MKKESYCNKTTKYFKGENLSQLYKLYSEKLSFALSQHIQRTSMKVPYELLWKWLKSVNGNLYNEIRSVAENHPHILGDIETKIFFITGRQFFSDLGKLTFDQKSKLISVINMILRKSICNPLMRPIIWNPRDMRNNGDLYIANSHNIGNLRTGINHLLNENVIEINWSQYINNDFVSAKMTGFPRDKLNQYYQKIKDSLSQADEIAKTDRSFGFERIVRDIIRTELSGIYIKSILIPEFNVFQLYKHHEFETDILAENSSQRWIIEISTGHKNSNEILNKFYKRKSYFNNERENMTTIGMFIVSNHGVIKETRDTIIVITIAEFVEILKANKIRDTITCFGFK